MSRRKDLYNKALVALLADQDQLVADATDWFNDSPDEQVENLMSFIRAGFPKVPPKVNLTAIECHPDYAKRLMMFARIGATQMMLAWGESMKVTEDLVDGYEEAGDE